MKTIELKYHNGKKLWINVNAIAAVQEHADQDDWCYVYLTNNATFSVNHAYADVLHAIASCVALDSQ